jgi:SAM-dependent methyltransferase
MNFFDLKDISEQEMELLNPISPEKVILAGKMAGLKPGSQVIEFGCGYGEVLKLWAKSFGIRGVGIDIRATACERASKKMIAEGLANQIQIVCKPGAEYEFEPHAYDFSTCIGSSFVWESFQPALHNLKEALKPGGKIIIGEPYWLDSRVPPDFSRIEKTIYTEFELLRMMWEEGLELEFEVRSSHDDWDRYETGNWQGLTHWINAHPDHPERQQVIEHLHASQEEYLHYGREYFGWAIYVLSTSFINP